MENRNQLKDRSIAAVLTDIQESRKNDVIVAADRVRLHDLDRGETRIAAQFEGYDVPVNNVALGQMESSLMPGFSTFGRNLNKAGMRELYIRNANELLPRMKDNRFLRMQQRPGNEFTLRAWLSASYQRYDDDTVFGSFIDALENTPNSSEFQSIGGYRTDMNSYIKMVTREPLFSIKADGRERHFSPGFIFSNSEVGRGYCKIEVLMIDRYCTNGCIFSSDQIGAFKVMHRGKSFNDVVSGTLADQLNNVIPVERVQRAIETAVKAAFDKDLYMSYQEAIQVAAEIRIDDDDRSVELFAKHIGKTVGLNESEQKAVAQRMLETGDRSLFGVQAALTDEAKYASNYDRKLELERAGAKIFTEVPKRWKTISALVDAEKL